MDNNAMMQMAERLMSDPEIAELLQRPDILAKFQSLMSDPSQAMEAMRDPELMKIITKMQSLGGGGGGGGMGGMGGGMGSGAAPAAAAAPTAAAKGAATGTVHEPADDAAFDALLARALKEGFPVAVDYFATWCGPCKMVAPRFAELAASLAGRAVFIKVNCERLLSTARHADITAYPTFKFYAAPDGECRETVRGVDLNRMRSLIYALAEEAEETRRNARRFVHFPLVEREMVFYKAVMYDKVAEKIAATLDASAVAEALYSPGFASAAALKAPLLALCAALAAASSGSQPLLVDDEMFAAVGQLLAWPADQLGSALHLVRGLAATGAGCDGLCAGKAIPRAGPGAGAPNALAALCRASKGAATQTVAVLSVRAVANAFDRMKMRALAARAYDDIVDLCADNLARFAADEPVVVSTLAVLINLTITLDLAARSPRRDPALSVTDAQVYLLNAVVEALAAGVGADVTSAGSAAILYRLIVVVGTLLVGAGGDGGSGGGGDSDGAVSLHEFVQAMGVGDMAADWSASADAKVAAAAKELAQVIKNGGQQ